MSRREGQTRESPETAKLPLREFTPHELDLLSRVASHGVLLPPRLAANSQPLGESHPLLGRLLTGHADGLEPFYPGAIDFVDTRLGSAQREAVARALHTPDICLIQGPADSGKARVAAEIISQAVNRGLRVLLLASTSAALDRTLHGLASQDRVLAVRCLGPDESPQTLPKMSRASIFADRLRSWTSQIAAQARADITAADQRRSRLDRDASAWPRFMQLAQEWEQLEENRQALQSQRGRLSEEIAQDLHNTQARRTHKKLVEAIAAIGRKEQETRLRLDKVQVDLNSRREAGKGQLSELAEQVSALTPLVQAKKQARWWTWDWWRATLQSKWMAKWQELQAAQQQLAALDNEITMQIAALEQEKATAQKIFETERLRILQGEQHRREALLTVRETEIQKKQDAVRHQWQSEIAALAEKMPHEEISTKAVLAAEERWRASVQQAQEQLALARDWSKYLEQNPEALASRLPLHVNLVAATPESLRHDRYFAESLGNGAPPAIHFDLLVLVEAEQLSEADLVTAARRAGRWILLANYAPGQARAGKVPTVNGRSPAISSSRPSAFQRLWQVLNCNPRDLPYAWVQQKDQLWCRLRSIAPAQRKWIETERVADFPEVELRILVPPRSRPVLVEVAFPLSMPIEEAKQYIFRELQEFAVQAPVPGLLWLDEPERLILSFSNRLPRNPICVDLEPGVCEKCGLQERYEGKSRRQEWHTHRIEFDKTAGWTRQRAEEWLQRYLGLCDLGRTVFLKHSDPAPRARGHLPSR